MYEILEGPGKGKMITKPQDKNTIRMMIEQGMIREVKEEKFTPETKELKQEIQTKEIEHRKRVPRKHKN